MQPASRVHDHGVDTPLDALIDRVEGDASRIGALAVRPHDLRADPLAPGLQLICRRSAERVRRAQHHRLPVSDEHPGQLAARRGLPGAVHPDDQHHRRTVSMPGQSQRPVHIRAEHREQAGPQQAADLRGVVRADDLYLSPQLVDHVAGRADAHVRGDEDVFHLLPGLLVELAGGDEVEQHGADRGMRPGEPADAAGSAGRPTAAAFR